MKHFSILPGLVLAALTLVAADTPIHADKPAHICKPVNVKKPPHTRAHPFQAFGTGSISSGGMYAQDFKATHLGHTNSLLVSFSQASLENNCIFAPDNIGGILPPGVLTSANGDVLYFYFDADWYVIDVETGVVNTTVTFTGGTGRFQDATGSADVVLDFLDVFIFQSFSFLIDGSIDY